MVFLMKKPLFSPERHRWEIPNVPEVGMEASTAPGAVGIGFRSFRAGRCRRFWANYNNSPTIL